jgi:hypothetical protein
MIVSEIVRYLDTNVAGDADALAGEAGAAPGLLAVPAS